MPRDLRVPLDFRLLAMTELRTKPGEILDRVADGGEAFLIERNGMRRACLVPLSVFLPDVSPVRIADEVEELTKAGESPITTVTPEREMAFRFPRLPRAADQSTNELGPEAPHEITVVLPHGYPNSCPRVYATALKDGVPHRWSDGALCLFGVMSTWNPGKHSVAFTLALARRWLKGYDEWSKTGQWPQAGESA